MSWEEHPLNNEGMHESACTAALLLPYTLLYGTAAACLASAHSHGMMVLTLRVRSRPAVPQAAQVVRGAHAPEDPGGRGGGEPAAALPLLL